jgi:hypothetical protein
VSSILPVLKQTGPAAPGNEDGENNVSTTKTHTIASLRARLEDQAAEITQMEAAGALADTKYCPLALADEAWNQISLRLLIEKAQTADDIVAKAQTLVERAKPPGFITDDSILDAFHAEIVQVIGSR